MGSENSVELMKREYWQNLDYYVLIFDLTSKWDQFEDILGFQDENLGDFFKIILSIRKVESPGLISNYKYPAEVRFYKKINYEINSWSKEIIATRDDIDYILEILAEKRVRFIIEKTTLKSKSGRKIRKRLHEI